MPAYLQNLLCHGRLPRPILLNVTPVAGLRAAAATRLAPPRLPAAARRPAQDTHRCRTAAVARRHPYRLRADTK